MGFGNLEIWYDITFTRDPKEPLRTYVTIYASTRRSVDLHCEDVELSAARAALPKNQICFLGQPHG